MPALGQPFYHIECFDRGGKQTTIDVTRNDAEAVRRAVFGENAHEGIFPANGVTITMPHADETMNFPTKDRFDDWLSRLQINLVPTERLEKGERNHP
jgi:hypothetical protein